MIFENNSLQVKDYMERFIGCVLHKNLNSTEDFLYSILTKNNIIIDRETSVEYNPYERGSSVENIKNTLIFSYDIPNEHLINKFIPKDNIVGLFKVTLSSEESLDLYKNYLYMSLKETFKHYNLNDSLLKANSLNEIFFKNEKILGVDYYSMTEKNLFNEKKLFLVAAFFLCIGDISFGNNLLQKTSRKSTYGTLLDLLNKNSLIPTDFFRTFYKCLVNLFNKKM